MRLPVEIIRAKRDGETLDTDAIRDFVTGFQDGSVSDAQVAAFAMAVIFKGLDRAETVALTLSMRDSGTVLDWSGLDRPVVDKHSTGGIGDNVSLMLAPILAACGAAVPMISGRGLGHTGGTLDKLESIPGYDITPEPERLRRLVKDVGCAIVGPTGDLAPADKRFYGVRDVTATVESQPLIVASILSKKLAAGLQSLVLDVKVGTGAFMRNKDDADALASALVEVANGAGLTTSALITGMDEPLAPCAGNAIEVRQAVRFLAGEPRDGALEEVVLALAAEMLVLSGLADNAAEGEGAARRAIESGSALEAFEAMIAGLGGPSDFSSHVDRYLAPAPITREVPALTGGTLDALDGRAIGMAVVGLGGGRRLPEDRIDPRVGFSGIQRLGTQLTLGEPLAFVHAASEEAADRAIGAFQAAARIGDGALRSASDSRVQGRIGPTTGRP
ncbi:MAG: thymidine phosphorylase [Pseudomonadota bacterium]|nr:thymidine phosphorylase [Pseudomonadota bacterium]